MIFKRELETFTFDKLFNAIDLDGRLGPCQPTRLAIVRGETLAPISTSDVSSGVPPEPFFPHVAGGNDVGVLGAHVQLDANFEGLMTQFIDSEWPDTDQKGQRSARRLLSQPISRNLLTIIWKETVVPEDELRRSGVKKLFSEPDTINCYKLAVHLSVAPCDVAPNSTLFRRIIGFACKLSLITKTESKGRQFALSGTSTLDALMRELARKQSQALVALNRGGCSDV